MKRSTLLSALLFAGGTWLIRRINRDITEIKNKVVIVTGASSGVGREVARLFAAQGAHVVLIARRKDRLEALRDELQATGATVLAIPTDITDDAALEHVVKVTMNVFGRIDVLVNNAGVSIGGPLHETDPAAMQNMLHVNFTAPVRLIQLVLPVMIDQHSGHIVNVTSVSAAIYSPGYTAYVGAKGGLNSFTLALRNEVSHKGINVSLILPGWTRTEMFHKFREDEMHDAGLLDWSIKIKEPEEVAAHILNAVRHKQWFVVLGGIGFQVGAIAARYFPALMPFVYRNYFDLDKMVEALKKSGL